MKNKTERTLVSELRKEPKNFSIAIELMKVILMKHPALQLVLMDNLVYFRAYNYHTKHWIETALKGIEPLFSLETPFNAIYSPLRKQRELEVCFNRSEYLPGYVKDQKKRIGDTKKPSNDLWQVFLSYTYLKYKPNHGNMLNYVSELSRKAEDLESSAKHKDPLFEQFLKEKERVEVEILSDIEKEISLLVPFDKKLLKNAAKRFGTRGYSKDYLAHVPILKATK